MSCGGVYLVVASASFIHFHQRWLRATNRKHRCEWGKIIAVITDWKPSFAAHYLGHALRNVYVSPIMTNFLSININNIWWMYHIKSYEGIGCILKYFAVSLQTVTQFCLPDHKGWTQCAKCRSITFTKLKEIFQTEWILPNSLQVSQPWKDSPNNILSSPPYLYVPCGPF